MQFAYFNSIKEKRALASKYLSFNPHPDVWVGYTDQNHEGTWTSVNGERPKLTLEFQVNEPSNSGGDENCLHMEHKGENFLFNDVNCAIKQRFICQKTEVLEPPTTTTTTTTVAPTTTTVAPTTTTVASTPTKVAPKVVKLNEIGQFEYSHRKGVTVVTWYVSESKETWSDSVDICEKQGKYLATFDKAAEANALLAAYAKYNPHSNTWIGYTDQDQEGRWTDINDKDLMFPIEFHDNEPNNSGGNEHCLQMWNKNNQLKYNDDKCDKKVNFICVTYSYRPKSYTVTKAPTVSSTSETMKKQPDDIIDL